MSRKIRRILARARKYFDDLDFPDVTPIDVSSDDDIFVETLDDFEDEERSSEPQKILVMNELDFSGADSDGGGEVRNVPIFLHELPDDVKMEVSAGWKPPKRDNVDERYPLVPPYAYAHVYWSGKDRKLRYDVEEPPLTAEERGILERLKTLLLDLVDVSSYEFVEKEEAERYISKKYREIIEEYGFKLTPLQTDKLGYYIIRDFTGLERVEPLMHDENLEDISCIGPGIPIYVYHRFYGSLKTNVVFKTHDELNKFIVRLAQMCGRHVSVAHPLLEGTLADGSRVEAMYAVTKDISTKGSTFTIRKFSKDPLTITDLMRFGTLPPILAAYFWVAIENRQSVLISGGTATGKTTMLNVLSLFIPPGAKIISIEDTPELRLPHEHWVQKIARESVREGEKITMFDLLKASLRERPDYIVVGEVRGKEAYVLFQGMATGHPGLATIHAEDIETLTDRLTSPPISLSPSLLHSLDIIVFMGKARRDGIDVRRLRELHEVIGVDLGKGKPITSMLSRWNASKDSFEFISDKSYVVDRIVEERGVSVESVWSEIRRRELVLRWMREKNIRYYRDVGKIISWYYQSPDKLMEEIRNDSEVDL